MILIMILQTALTLNLSHFGHPLTSIALVLILNLSLIYLKLTFCCWLVFHAIDLVQKIAEFMILYQLFLNLSLMTLIIIKYLVFYPLILETVQLHHYSFDFLQIWLTLFPECPWVDVKLFTIEFP